MNTQYTIFLLLELLLNKYHFFSPDIQSYNFKIKFQIIPNNIYKYNLLKVAMEIKVYTLCLLFVLLFSINAFTLFKVNDNVETVSSSLIQKHLQNPILNVQAAAHRLLQSTGVTNVQSSITKYSNIILYQDLPTNFVIGEVYQLKGKIISVNTAASTSVYCNFVNSLTTTTNYTFFYDVPAGQTQFSFRIDTRGMVTGKYYVRLWGNGGGSIWPSVLFNFLATQPTKTYSAAPTVAPSNFAASFTGNKLFISWNEDNVTPIQKLTFTQGTITKEYILTNFVSKFQVPFADFANFVVGTAVTVKVSSAYSSTFGLWGRISNYSPASTLTFTAGQHAFSEKSAALTLTSVIPQIIAPNTTLNIQGTCTQVLANQYFTQEPDLTVGKYLINSALSSSSTISSNTPISISFKFTKQGVYIFQINANTGSAVLNRPIYVYPAGWYPLKPDFVDLTPNIYLDTNALQAIKNSQPTTLVDQRSLLLSLTNQKRQQWKQNAIPEDSLLDTLAQGHSNNMLTYNFVGHTDQNGNGVSQRAALLNITASYIGQNVAMNLKLAEAHYRLCRSPGHLANIVSPNFQLVGFGVARNSNGYFLVTENFASSPLKTTTTSTNTTSTTNIQPQIISWIKKNYPAVTKENPAITSAINQWFANPGGVNLITYLSVNKGLKPINLYGLNMSPYSDTIVNSFKFGYLQPAAGLTTVGAGYKVNGTSVSIYAAYMA